MQPRNKQPKSIDGVGFARRKLTDYRRLQGNPPLRTSKQADLNRPRQRLDMSVMNEELKSLDKANETTGKRRGRTRRSRIAKRPRRILMAVGIVIALVLGFLGIKALIALQQITERNLSGGALALQDNIDPTQLKGEGDGRVNILVIGIGGAGHPGGQLADTIMVISIDPINNTATMLSVPRDFYLKVPNYYSMRINEIHAVGEDNKQQKANGGGPALLSENLERVLGIPMHYFVRVDFQGFIDAIDTVGGIDIEVKDSVFDPFIEKSFGSGNYGFSIKTGTHHLDGATALQYGRSRKTSSDFARASRQQEVLIALKNKVLSLSTLSNPLKVSSLISAAGNHVRTDLTIDEIMKLLTIGKRIENSTIDYFVLTNAGDNYLASRNIGGASVLIPKAGLDNFTQIQKFVRSQLLVDGFIKNEGAQIVILNGTSKPGLADKAGDYLKGYGYNVIETGDAPQKNIALTALYDQSGGQKQFTLKLLEKRLKVTAQAQSPHGIVKSADLIIVLGNDFHIP